jgi:protein involved in polysaccharide export with SLBB domain
VDCFIEGDFYLTVKLGWILSKPEMTVLPESLDFGQVKVGTTAQQIVTVANQGNANLSLQTVFFVLDSNPDFSHTPLEQLPYTIEPGDTVDVTVIFAPTAEGQALGVLKVTGDDADTPFIDVVTTGTGIVPDITIEPAANDFGQLVVGNSSTGTVLITNNGQADLIISDIAWAAGGSADFAVAALPALPLTLAPAASAQLEIVYTPTAAGSVGASLQITSDDLDESLVTVAMTGQAVSPVVTPYEQIKAMIAFFDESVKNGAIVGVGKGKCAKMNVQAFKEALKITKSLIRCERKRCAIGVLNELDKFTDGQSRPTDIIKGSAVPELNARIETLLETLKTQ